MTVIAMTREMGTLGKDVALGLAETLDYRIVHHELVEHDLAQRLGVQESAVHHYLEGSATLLERWKIDKKKLSRLTAVEILELAQDGNVIIRGWGATALLKDVPNVLRVRVCAPMAFRENVMKERLRTNDQLVVRREIKRNDAAHARTVETFFGIDWQDPIHYNVVINSEKLPTQASVRMLRLLTDDAAFQETAATRSALADKLIEWRVRSALTDRESGALSSGIDVGVKDGQVMLTGTGQFDGTAKLAEQIVRDIPGVRGIETRIVILHNYGGV